MTKADQLDYVKGFQMLADVVGQAEIDIVNLRDLITRLTAWLQLLYLAKPEFSTEDQVTLDALFEVLANNLTGASPGGSLDNGPKGS